MGFIDGILEEVTLCRNLKDECGIVRNIHMVFVPSSWHRAPKTLEISYVIGASSPLFFTQLFIMALFVTVKNWKQAKCLSGGEQINCGLSLQRILLSLKKEETIF